MKRAYLLCLTTLLVIIGVFAYGKSRFDAKEGGLSKEQIYEIHKEYVESVYGPGAGFRIVSYGESGTGRVNHETGEVFWDMEGR